MKDALDRDKLTKSFYQSFSKEREAFQEFLRGIPEEDLQRWYVAVLLNRLMFIYFFQQKGFLDGGDKAYLRNKLDSCKGAYYRDFLCPLFFQGFALQEAERPATVRRLLGSVPYLNGGIFQKHQIEELHGKTIEISNQAFERLFAFFDKWQWHLDERPIAHGNEINPEVLGYIFEKYVNQKQMGAYYTKEDITEYIGKNTIIPFLFDDARAKCKIAFEGHTEGGTGVSPVIGGQDARPPLVWDLLKADPDRYIYRAVRHGVDLPLPPEIAAGFNPPTLRQPVGEGPVLTLELRKGWNKPAPPEFALPTETWREVVHRRQRYEELKARLLAIGAKSSTGVPPVDKESGTGVPPVNKESGTGVPPVNKESGIGVSPAVFHPFQPSAPLDITQRNLPHWQQAYVTYFVTFRLGDSLPAAKLRLWTQEKKAWLDKNPRPWTPDRQEEYARLFPRRLNEWLDAGEGSCLLENPIVSEIVENAFRHFDGARYLLDEFVIMPNHVHVLFSTMNEHSLSDVLHS